MTQRELVVTLAILFLLGVGATAARIIESRRTGLSLRLQVFIPLATITLILSAIFAIVVIDRFTARASLFATRAAEDEARGLAELAARTPQESLRPVLQAFTRSAIDTDVALLDAQGRVVMEAGEANQDVARVSAEAPIAGGGRVRVRKATFGMVQLMSDVAPKVALLALMFAVASAALAVLIGGAVAIPIERLTRAAQRVAAGERQAPLPEPRGREVRELTHALEQMRRELEERHALETFVADLSHELKNPVAAIRASAEVLTEGALDEPETARRFALRIRESADKLQQLTQDLLSLARLEARGVEMRDEPVDFARIAREAVDAQSPLAQARAVSLEIRGDGDSRVRGDPVWLRRAVENLLGNAIQHSPDGSKVVVEIDGGPQMLVATVRDEGSGVDDAIRGRLFSRFATTRHGEGGTGLGLAIVRAVAELHGGKAELRESSPSGAAFSLSLPRA
ncbi:MAG TPA: ATP-binding protein [Myxococcales bacterium]|jgi:signal transduction histidine kinase